MTTETPEVWVYLGRCPVCAEGLCRIRACTGRSAERNQPTAHLFAVCDECEAVWTHPDLDSQWSFADAADPACPVCEAPLFGSQARWARPADIRGTRWEPVAIVQPVVRPESRGAPGGSEGT